VPPREGCRLPLRLGLLPASRLTHAQRRWPAPFAPRALHPLRHYYGAVRPCPTHRYFRPHGWRRLCLFACHRRTGSQVPYESPNESHAPSTPDTAWPVGRLPPCSSRNIGKAPVLMSSKQISMLERRFTCVRLSHPYLTRSLPRLFHDVHHRGFWPKQLMAVWSLLLQSGSEGSSFISRTARRRRTGVFMTQCHFLPCMNAIVRACIQLHGG
jgi:hypothetical protein